MILPFLLLFLLLPLTGWSDANVPGFINFQSIMRGDNGELVTDPFVDLEFQVTDSNGQILYDEQQADIQVIRGAVNVLIGEGVRPGTNQLTGGLPGSIFDPRTGSKFLHFQVGANLMGDGIELVSMPYAVWSEQALHVVPNSIGSEEIKDGSIELKDLARSIQFSDVQGTVTEAQVPASLATDVELAAHATAKVAHKASQISANGPYMAYPAKDVSVEEIIKALDEKVYLYKINSKEDFTKVTTGTTTALTTHTTATTAHGSDGNVVGLNTLNNALTTHAGLKTGVHGLTSADPNNAIVGTTEAQTLTNKTLQGAILTNPVITGGTFSGNLLDNTVETNDLQIGAVTGDKIADGTITDADISATANITRLGQTIEASEITDGTITDADLSPTAGITDTKLATITTAGKVADTSLSATVTKLGQTIESGEITDGTIVNTDISNSANIDVSKISGFGGLATLGAVGTDEIKDGTITTVDLNAISFAGWDQNSADDVTTATSLDSLAGTLSESKIDGSITRDSEVVSVINNAVDGSINGKKIDSIANITGVLTEGQIPSSIARDSELPTVPQNLSELGGTVSTDQVPSFMRPAAFGSVFFTGAFPNPEPVTNAYNITNADNLTPTPQGDPTCGQYHIRFNFTTKLSDENYIVMITPRASATNAGPVGISYLLKKDKAFVDTCLKVAPSSGADIVVFHP